MKHRIALTSIIALMASPVAAEEEVVESAPLPEVAAEAELFNLSEKPVGKVTFTQGAGAMVIKAMFHDLPEGVQAFHIHENGSCDHGDGFKSAGGHLTTTNPKYPAYKQEHGVLVSKDVHAGDLPNIYVPKNGKLTIEYFKTDLVVEQLLEGNGTSLMIHEGPDDYVTQPSGGAGPRIACGVIKAIPALDDAPAEEEAEVEAEADSE